MQLRIGKVLTSIFAILVTASSAAAEPLPQGRRVEVGREMLHCFNFDEYKSLVVMNRELEAVSAEMVLDKERKVLLSKEIDLLKGIQKVQVAQVKLFSDENERLFQLWKEENRKRHVAENKPAWGSYLAWSLAGVFAVSTATLVGVAVID